MNIIFLQDVKENQHAKNTAHLVTLCDARARIVASENDDALNSLKSAVCDSPEAYAVLYPCDQSIGFEEAVAQGRELPGNLIFLDGTWRKAYKLWQTLTWLHAVPTFHFSNPPKGRYAIRKAPKEEALSTLEAVAYALETGYRAEVSPLYKAFDAMQQTRFARHPQVSGN